MRDVTTEGGSMAGETGDQSTAQQAKERVQETAQQATQQAQEKAQEWRGQAGMRVREQVDSRSTQVGSQLQSTADAVRRTTEQLRNEGQEGPANIATSVAERAERLGNYLTDSDADQILRDIEDFARRQPWLIAAAGGALGFFAARMLKASSSRRYETDGRYVAALPPPSVADTPGVYTTAETGGYATPVTPPDLGEPAMTPGATAGAMRGDRIGDTE